MYEIRFRFLKMRSLFLLAQKRISSFFRYFSIGFRIIILGNSKNHPNKTQATLDAIHNTFVLIGPLLLLSKNVSSTLRVYCVKNHTSCDSIKIAFRNKMVNH